MFKHIKAVSVLSLILFLAGIFCIIFSLNEINTVTAENSGNYDTAVENTGLKKIIITGGIPMEYHWDYGEEFNISVKNINPENIEVREEGGELYINYEIKPKNMDRLFLPLIGYATNTRPLIKITIPEHLAVTDRIDNSMDYFFNLDLVRIFNSKSYPDTRVELTLDDAANGVIMYDDQAYYNIFTEIEHYIEIENLPDAPDVPQAEDFTTVWDNK